MGKEVEVDMMDWIEGKVNKNNLVFSVRDYDTM